jgi:DeoR/GlpR family transcriptional regulator of sugar metabolism
MLREMLASERHLKIIALLDELGTVRTMDLAEQFEVTDETIRRDLQILSENHLINRVHGGASSLGGMRRLQSFAERTSIQVDQKKAIAKAALEWILPNQTYAFDSSTTAFEMVLGLPDMEYRVVTNAFAVIDHLTRFEEVEIISTGGRFHRKTNTFNGPESISTLRRHNINTAFISCIGLDLHRGVSEGFEEQAGFKEILVKMAEKVVLLIDSSKMEKRSEYFFAELGNISEIVTD